MSGVDVHVFRESVARVVRALTDSNIKVRQQGANAYVEYDAQGRPFCVTLPSIPDNASLELLNAIQGFLDHEVGHLLHTDFKFSRRQMDQCRANKDKVRPALWNIIEDVFVERSMVKRFTGSMINIDNIQRFLANKFIREGYEARKKKGADTSEIRSFLLPSAVRAAAGQKPFVDFMSDKWHEFGEIAKPIQDLGPKFAKANSTAECWGLTDELYSAIVPPKPPASKCDNDGEEDESDEKQQGDGKSEGEQAPDAKSDENEPDEESGDEQGTPERSDDQAETQDDGEAEPDKGEEGEGDGDTQKGDSDEESNDNSDEEEESDCGSGSEEEESEEEESEEEESEEEESESEEQSGSGDSEGESEEEESDGERDDSSADGDSSDGGDSSGDDFDPKDDEAADADHHASAVPEDVDHGSDGGNYMEEKELDLSIEDLIDPEMIKPMDEVAAEAIAKDIQEFLALNPGEYVPFTRDHDYVGPLPAAEYFQTLSLDSSYVAKDAGEMCHVIQSEVERIFKARSAARWNPGQRKGKLNRGALHRICLNDDRAFRTKIDAQNKDVAVQLVIDCSGSMHGSKIASASTAAYMLATIFERINVPFEVLGFTTVSNAIAGHLEGSDWRKVQREFEDAFRNSHYGYTTTTTYARYAPIALYVFKEFQKRFDDTAKKTLGFLPTTYGFMANNIDGESIELAAMRLQARREARKVMIVMSDGQPAGDGSGSMQRQKLKQVVEDIGRSNIEIYGLGLMDRAVLNYYPKAEVIDYSSEIPTKVMALIQRLLVS